jgi:glycosyltransferase involved in cell wall biosynthesis
VADARVSVVIPAYNAARTLGEVLSSLSVQEPRPFEVVVVDDGSTDDTAAIARASGARVVETDHKGYAGGARNRGWDAATGDVVVFMDSDVVPDPGWGAGLARALREHPGALVGCARTFAARGPWQWVAHLQIETPYLPRGEPREVQFLSSYCLAVPREAPIRFDESYGGEDAVFSIDAQDAGLRLVFDPRFTAAHHHGRDRFRDLLRQQDRFAYGMRRLGPVQREGLQKRVFSRVPLHYFALVRLLLIWRRLRDDEQLRPLFVRLLPRLIVAEWALGGAAVKYAVRPRPPLRGQTGSGFRYPTTAEGPSSSGSSSGASG